MLSVRRRHLAKALDEMGWYSVCKIAGALIPDARRELRKAPEMPYIPGIRSALFPGAA